MTKNIKLFLIVILVSLPFWWGVNVLQESIEDFFYAREIEKNPSSLFIAQIAESYTLKSQETVISEGSQIGAESVMSVEIDKTGAEKVLFSRAENQKMPIASLTKLMTAVVAEEIYQDSQRIQISKEALNQDGNYGELKPGEILKVEDLLYIMLLESSNDAAFALTEETGIEGFVHLMNLKAEAMGLKNTRFFNPTGLDPEDSKPPIYQANYSTVKDLVKLTKYLLKESLILNILSKKEYDLYLENGVFHHTLQNTNELLGEIPGIIAGKTGYTERAGGCLILILEGRSPGTYLINVILNSPDKFEDMRKLCSQ